MYPGLAELVAGLPDVMHTAYQCFKRAFEVFGQVLLAPERNRAYLPELYDPVLPAPKMVGIQYR